ncbi:EcsC family protein [Ideonella sp. 4Y11]|uniref:EcsC family protein n=1 Tax=Ideonella aquatica TaxID=2824119 RepID=A0A941BQ16_9BURK|nr:EcsC family protein [Ideonella aquatica]MBQ0958635.1 EcsC family protein [Ideonella aquatica]
MSRSAARATPESQPADALGSAVLGVIGQAPRSRLRRRADPAAACDDLIRRAAGKSAMAAGALALPLGPIGWLTVLPELATVWRLQSALVADIAAVHGHPPPSPEQLLYCLFDHTGARIVRQLLVQTGERGLVQVASAQLLRMAAAKVGASIAKRVAGRSLARWLPLAGAAGMAAWAAWDTRQVGRTAQALYARPLIAD